MILATAVARIIGAFHNLGMGLKIIFAGTPEMAVPTLKALVGSDHQIVAVYTAPDRPAGRGRHLTASPIKDYALSQSLPIMQPEVLNQEALSAIKEVAPDVMVVVAYGLLLPKAVLAIPEYGCVNLHFSLLPRWRGAAPVQHTLLHGDEEAGVTVMQMDQGLDTGPILSQETYPVDPDENAKRLYDRLAEVGATLLLKTLDDMAQNALDPMPQDESRASYASKIKKSQGLIDWHRSATGVVNQVRAFNPWPVAFTYFRGKRLRIWDAALLDVSADLAPGMVMATSKQGIEVATGDGVLRITSLQLPGGRILSASEFLNAHATDLLPGETVFYSEEGT